jgi:hypothetical protein
MKKGSYSKKICAYSLITFSLSILVAIISSFIGIVTDVFAYIIPSIGAVAAASVVFYYNKAFYCTKFGITVKVYFNYEK